ncbi:hypothetical protein DRO31_01680 [Candidatus Bathyarchaeota archaeon]|nr:MAG: hypothetical protein DRO31_01680 [Candidatus Bathyarchaeota archaeon]
MGASTLPAVNAVPNNPNILPRTSGGNKSVLNALKAGILTLKPRLLILTTIPACVIDAVKGSKPPVILLV